MIKTRRGLDLPIKGAPSNQIEDARGVRTVAVLGDDYIGMKPTMAVAEGDRVTTGQVLFSDKKTEGVVYTSPATGTVSSINRGAKRALLSVVIDIDSSDDSAERFDVPADLAGADREAVQAPLLASGLWTALRARPFSRVPDPGTTPDAIFITAMDTNPLAGDPAPVLDAHADDFVRGQQALAKLSGGALYVCSSDQVPLADGARGEQFSGPHPAGLAGTHIHFLHPVGPGRTVWYINYQDVIAVGRLFADGQLWTERVVALGGPGALNPRLLRTRLGANLDELTAGEISGEEVRVISGSVLAGRTARGAVAYLGRYHQQVSVLNEDRKRHFLGYLYPGARRHSVLPVYSSSLGGEIDFTTTTHGSARAMVPVGTYERVMPHDLMPTQLLRALLVGDVETAINLGCLELDEEDVALCTYACPGKYEFGPVLRENLTLIEKEG